MPKESCGVIGRPFDVIIISVAAILALIGLVDAGPIQVRAEQDSNTNFHVGPEARTTFELVEEYHPLATAVNQQHPSRLGSRAMASSLSKGRARRPPSSSSAQTLIDFGDGQDVIGQRSDRFRAPNSALVENVSSEDVESSRWLEWTRWSACANGERVRVRQCLEVAGVRCEGESVQRQTCFSTDAAPLVPVARDPLVIENEIRGVDEPLLAVRRRA